MAPNHDLVRERAYMLWLESGGAVGRCDEHWLRAEQEMAAASTRPAASPAKKTAAPKRSASPKAVTAAAAAKPRASRRASATA